MVAMATTSTFWVGAALWLGAAGAGQLLDINTLSLRQAITPPELLGRVISIASVLAWSAIPLGGLLGGYAISRSGNVAAVYAGCGAVQMLLASLFALGPLGHAERYIPFAAPRGEPGAAPAPHERLEREVAGGQASRGA